MSEAFEVARCLPFLLEARGGYLRLERTLVPGHEGTWRRDWYRLGSLDWIARSMGSDDCMFGPVPHGDRNGWPGVYSSVLWVRTSSRKSERLLRWFTPRPTLLMADGETCHRTALWALSGVLDRDWTVRLNRRIAHRLFAPKKDCGMDALLPAPGTVLRRGRTNRPALVRVEAWRPEAVYGAREVAGGLRDAPDPEAWKERQAL